MKVFVAGATGALGRPVVRALRLRGHAVAGLTRDPRKRLALESLGAEPFVADALDAEALLRAVRTSRATHLVQLLTALPPAGPLRARDIEATNALRTQGTRNMVAAAIGVGAKRLVAESFVGVYGGGNYDEPQGEDGALPPAPTSGPFVHAAAAMRAHEALLREVRAAGRLETVVLRFGGFYGPEVAGTLALVRQMRSGRMVVPSGARGVISFVHVDDAARAVVAALEQPAPGPLYNVVDDRPMLFTEAFAQMAQALDAPPPWRVPLWLLRVVAPVPARAATIRLPLSNARAKRELGWALSFPTLREGLVSVARLLPDAA